MYDTYKCLAVAVCVFGLIMCEIRPASAATDTDTYKYLKNLREKGYDNRVKPLGHEDHTSLLEVGVSMYILDIHKVDDKNMEYMAQFYIRQVWNDSRLVHGNKSPITLNDMNLIWTPDLFFVQEKEGIHHKLVSPNSFIRIQPNGEVKLSVRLSMTFSCRMNFAKYPHDSQKCAFSIESYGYTRDHLLLTWLDKDALGYDASINLLPFALTHVGKSLRDVEFSFGKFRVLEVTFNFQRKFGFYLTRIYLPYVILVALSWICFWIPSKMISFRLSLVLAIMYLMVNLASGINDHIPPTAYTKASDIWIATCQSVVFAVFLEFIAVHILEKNREKYQKKICKQDPETQKVLKPEDKYDCENRAADSVALTVASRLKKDLISCRVDKLSRILFPVMFLIFNFVYWLVCCH